MNKTVKIALIAAPLVLAYPAAAWVTGKQIETAIGEHYQLLAENPSAKIVNRDYQRGIFGATETVTIELFGNFTAAMTRQQQEVMAANPGVKLPPVKPLQIRVRSEIRHGPLPGFSKLAAAVVDSELLLDGELQQQVAAVFGTQKPLEVHSEYRFDGGGVSRIRSPGFSTNWAANEGAGRNMLTWEGFQIDVDFKKGVKSYTLQAEAPKLTIRDSKGGGLVMNGMRLEAVQQRLFDDDPLLYVGEQKMTLAQLDIRPEKEGDAVVLKQLAYDVAMPVSGDYVDLIARLGTASLQVGQQEFGPANYDFSLRHLHGRTLATLYRTLVKVYGDPTLAMAADANPAQLWAPIAKPATDLLKHAPEIRLDRLSFRSPHGDATLAARVALKDFSEADLANPMLLLAKLDASADVAVPEALVGSMANSLPAGRNRVEEALAETAEGVAAPSAEELAAQRGEQLRQQLALFIEQGLVLRDGSLIKSKLAFSQGQMTINGKPFNPMAMGAPNVPGAPGGPM
jgi:uncharacterized protein YdgA (DUF945 family)